MSDPLLIDTDVWVEGERRPLAVADWLANQDDVATCEVVWAEFLIGVHAAAQASTRAKARRYFEEIVSAPICLPIEGGDFERAARLIGEAIRAGKARPTLGDGLIAACALRSGRWVATGNDKDFQAMGVPTVNPLARL